MLFVISVVLIRGKDRAEKFEFKVWPKEVTCKVGTKRSMSAKEISNIKQELSTVILWFTSSLLFTVLVAN